ncbi:MAG: hypothetical protein ABJB16_11990 [Saprospiraceae bacterium]
MKDNDNLHHPFSSSPAYEKMDKNANDAEIIKNELTQINLRLLTSSYLLYIKQDSPFSFLKII